MRETTARRDLRRRTPCRYRARRRGLDRRTRLTGPSRPLRRGGLDRHAAASSLVPSSIGLCADDLNGPLASFFLALKVDPGSAARRAAALAEPGAVFRHFLPLRLRCTPFAGQCFLAAFRRTPAQLGAIVDVIRHLQSGHAIEHVLERQKSIASRRCVYRKICAQQVPMPAWPPTQP